MPRLIDADEIVKVAEHAYHEWNLAMAAADGKREINLTYKMQELCKAVKAVADAAPTIDAEPVRHGVWEYQPATLGTKAGYQCTACRGSVWNSPDVPQAFKRCPECGAKMDGGADGD